MRTVVHSPPHVTQANVANVDDGRSDDIFREMYDFVNRTDQI